MALPSAPASISLGQIQTEFGGSNPISLSEYYKGGSFVSTGDTAPNVPTSGQISMSNFRGAIKYNGPPTVEYLVVAGGGAGAAGPVIQANAAGAGGAGGFKTATGKSVTKGTSYTVTVGAGGTWPGYLTPQAGDGTSSVFDNIQTTGGGGGGGWVADGRVGGSGGGAGWQNEYTSPIGGAGTPGEGNAGGNSTVFLCGGAGGGAGAAGSASVAPANPQIYCNFPPGGAGSAFAGTNYAGGGGVGATKALLATWAVSAPITGGAGGSGGGGNGGDWTQSFSSPYPYCSQSGGTNTGGGGGSGGERTDTNQGTAYTACPVPGNTCGNGGSGVVIVRYPNTYSDATTTGSPTYSNSGGYKTYTFTGSGTITWN